MARELSRRELGMIEFATLLIGLIVGERSVVLAVQPPISIVEVLLDGETVATMDRPPWKARIDLGSQLRPHRLVARGFDSDGALVDTTEQLLNYNRASFEATILLDPDPDGRPSSGRIVWRGALDDPPLAIALDFDGHPLAIDSRGRFELPPYDTHQIHVLESRVVFDRYHSAGATLTFGGEYGDQLTSALTAFPLRSPIDRTWHPSQVREWLAVNEGPAQVFRISGSPGFLVVLRSDGLDDLLRSLEKQLGRQPRSAPPHRLQYEVSAVSSRPLKGHRGTFRLTDLGPVSARGGLRRILLQKRPLVPERGSDGRRLKKKGQKLWDALAVAGARASASGKPRAVLVMLDSSPVDTSDLLPLSSTGYLRSIYVPLFVWAPSREALGEVQLADSSRRYVGPAQIDQMCLDIADELASQTVVWLQGAHIPGDVVLKNGAPAEVSFID